tara:strand:- start:4428 stop:5681 length:1254 start_codon:yes stop_codon:yes gene_type:complete
MRSRILPIVLLLIIITLVGFSNYRNKRSRLPLVDPIPVSNSASMSEKLTAIDHWLSRLSKERKFNGAILVSKNHKPDLMKTYGYEDLAREKPLTYQSSFRLGSVSKQFTAMAVMILNKQVKLKYDDPVQKYLPSFPYNDVTIRHLLTHTSGIADYMDLALKEYFSLFAKIEFYMNQSMVNLFYKGEPSEYKDHYTVLSSSNVLNMVSKYSEKRLFSAGEKYLYSNTGYVILSLVVEAISGKTFESFLDQEIFIPLKMENSCFWNLFTKPGKLSNRVQGTNGNRLNDYSWMDGVSGDGCVFLSIQDFLKWDNALKNNSLIPKSNFDEALSPYVSSKGDTTFYGFGWSLSKEGTSISHGGSWLGAVTYVYRKLDTDAMFVLLESSTSKYSYAIRKELQRVLNNTDPHMFSWEQIVVTNF